MKDLVGPYRIQSLLGHGGMGIVYLGVHDHLGREVAIKALAPELTRHPEFRERFFAEARVQARLQHTNIVTIYDLIEDEGSFFIVMEHVPGPTLETLLKEGAGKEWDLEHSLSLFRQILAGLDYAHSKGVIHRDVKPSNVLVAEGDLVKLTDFGIALLIGDKRLTASHSTIGTPTYMSPEQILRPRTVDHRSDVYSAAIVLYEMLAGQPPFDAETEYEIKKLQIESPVPDVRELRPEVPSEIANALSTALKKDPEERFQSAGAFLRAMRQDAVAVPIPPVPPVVTVAARDKVPLLDQPVPEPPVRALWKIPAAVAASVLVVAIPLLVFALRGRSADPPPVLESVPAAETPTPAKPPKEPRTDENAVPNDPAPTLLAASAPPEPSPIVEAPVQKSETPAPKVIERRPRDLEKERASPLTTDESFAGAVPAPRKTEQRALEAKLEVSDSPAALSPPPNPVLRRVSRKLTLTGVEIHPQVVPPGGQAVAVAHITVSPAFEQVTTISILARVMRSLDEIADPIGHTTTLPAGGGPWRITIPIKIPKGTAAGDCYVDVTLQDSAQQLRGSGRIGFTIR